MRESKSVFECQPQHSVLCRISLEYDGIWIHLDTMKLDSTGMLKPSEPGTGQAYVRGRS